MFNIIYTLLNLIVKLHYYIWVALVLPVPHVSYHPSVSITRDCHDWHMSIRLMWSVYSVTKKTVKSLIKDLAHIVYYFVLLFDGCWYIYCNFSSHFRTANNFWNPSLNLIVILHYYIWVALVLLVHHVSYHPSVSITRDCHDWHMSISIRLMWTVYSVTRKLPKAFLMINHISYIILCYFSIVVAI